MEPSLVVLLFDKNNKNNTTIYIMLGTNNTVEDEQQSNSSLSSDISEITTVEDFLQSLGGNIRSKYLPLFKKNQLNDLQFLVHAPRDMLDQLTGEVMGMTFFEKLKFHAAIKKLQMESQTQTASGTKNTAIAASDTEANIINKIRAKLTAISAIPSLLANALNKSEHNAVTQSQIIDEKFDAVMAQLQQRREELKAQITNEQMHAEKEQQIEKEAQRVAQLEKYVTQQLEQCEALLSGGQRGKQREQRLIAIEENITREMEREYAEYADTNAMIAHLMRVCDLKRIGWQSEIDIEVMWFLLGNITHCHCCDTNTQHNTQNISAFGEWDTSVSSSDSTAILSVTRLKADPSARVFVDFELESISPCLPLRASAIQLRLTVPTKQVDNANGNSNSNSNNNRGNDNNNDTSYQSYDIAHLLCKDGEEISVPGEVNSNNDDDIKVGNEDAENQVGVDMSVALNNGRYSCALNAKEIGIDVTIPRYEAAVVIVINSPVTGEIISNPTQIEFGTPTVNRADEVDIPLVVHSHKGHHGDNGPEKMLQSSNVGYLSPLNQITNDWLVFTPKQQQSSPIYHLTKIQVRTTGTSALKNFRILVGDPQSNEWLVCNGENTFVADRMEAGMQTFDIRLADDQWTKIWVKKWNHFKLEIDDNYGNCFILIQEMKLFGVAI